ncbi:acyl-CoA dehydrogenase [Rhodococcus sp. KBS0724]|uniref:acyl-CoA dehydrogenase family protein n=1 Tax=Rhodococcus sp. KBS0724 TaxID=1179674 RepID=UPI00110EAC8C|nr:acyl-CoA dehydrogenase family protein [Rhodococcus sp. KBS0724]TSD47801.1 acyl-CoA dehydrogenase [Rhodococcus sp. KBS0724]
MLLETTPDQDFFRDTTARFLSSQVPSSTLRLLRDNPAGYDAEYWRRGAELGWTSLLVDEAHGGGTISERGLVDLTLVAYEFGRTAAPGPLTPTNVVAALLSNYSSEGTDQVLAQLLSGTSTAAWCFTEPQANSLVSSPPLEIRVEGNDVVVSGVKRPVEAAQTADILLVTGQSGDSGAQVLMPVNTAGVHVKPLRSIDLTRRYAEVTFDNVRLPRSSMIGDAADAARDIERSRQLAIVLSCAESVGAMHAAFDLTVAWAFDRYSFGRPLASYQELKHRFADMKTWLEASHGLADAAAAAVAADSPDSAELTSAAHAYIGDRGGELLQDCVQIHGGIGVTFEHDLHLFMRRAAANRSSYGTPAEHRQLIAAIAIRQESIR